MTNRPRKELQMKNSIKGFFHAYIMILGLILVLPINAIVGKKAPNFTAQAIIEDQTKEISLSDFAGKNKILIFYPADFSFICPTELFAFQEKIDEFQTRNTQLLALSVDQIYSHEKWLSIPRKEGGIQGITYPVVSDITKKISSEYGVLDQDKGIALRGIIIIDKDDIVQASSIYNVNIGRNVDEALRVLDAVLFTQEHGQVCPANWSKGKSGLEATQEGLKNYLNKEQE